MSTSTRTKSSLLDSLIGLIETAPASDRFLLKFAFLVTVATGIWLALAYNTDMSAVTPIRGGSFTEGIVGTPRFVNPVLAITRADQDVTALVYSGLMKLDTTGKLVNDIAQDISISEDGLTYSITIRKDVKFHDDTPLTARDVVYTLQLIQDPDLKSPLRSNWTDVVIQQINEYELTIALQDAYAPFIENFTVGILPAHAWSSLPIEQLPFSQLNTEPIGSGPFSVESAYRDTSGVIDNYTLQAFRTNGYEPKIDTINLTFFSNETELLEALAKNNIDATSYLPTGMLDEALTNNYHLIETPMPRIFGIFYNQNKSIVLRDAAVREALEAALDRSALIAAALDGYGVPIDRPTTIPHLEVESEDGVVNTPTPPSTSTPETILEAGGWERNDLGLWEKEIDGEPIALEVIIRTSNTPLFEELLKEVVKQWEAIGVNVLTEQFEQTGLVQSVIRPRDFQALLFGIDTNRSYDLYSFWHSSQQDDPGLNIAQYANVNVDELLESSRNEQNEEARTISLAKASDIINAERPAAFLFQPTLTYVISTNVNLPTLTNLARPAERFSNISEWHTKSATLWPVFHPKNI
jgi:peptide/nickel transport system substrate-binding protein